MTRLRDGRGHGPGLPRAAAVLLAACALGVALAGCGMAETDGPPAGEPTVTASPAPGATAMQDPVARTPDADRSDVVVSRVVIPAIGVDAPVEVISRNGDGVLQPPRAWEAAGWYGDGVLPGEVGPAVIAGHLDTTQREAVFVDLTELRPGDLVTVTTSDGRSQDFAVDSAVDVAKKAFPTDDVYGPTPDAQLRLITCNGPFDDAESRYANNYVVFASAV